MSRGLEIVVISRHSKFSIFYFSPSSRTYRVSIYVENFATDLQLPLLAIYWRQ